MRDRVAGRGSAVAERSSRRAERRPGIERSHRERERRSTDPGARQPIDRSIIGPAASNGATRASVGRVRFVDRDERIAVAVGRDPIRLGDVRGFAELDRFGEGPAPGRGSLRSGVGAGRSRVSRCRRRPGARSGRSRSTGSCAPGWWSARRSAPRRTRSRRAADLGLDGADCGRFLDPDHARCAPDRPRRSSAPPMLRR